MTCANSVAPLQLSWKNVSLSGNGTGLSRGIALEIGTPPQTLSFRPTILQNNTLFLLSSDCGSPSNLSCAVPLGGVYDLTKSTSLSLTTYSQWNGTVGDDVDNIANIYLFLNDDISMANSARVFGFPFAIDTTEISWATEIQISEGLRQASLGLSPDSSFLRAAVEAAVVPSPVWSLWTGSRSITNPIDGMLMIGGYDEARVAGTFTTSPVTSLCGLSIGIKNITYDTDEGSSSLFTGPTKYIQGCLDPYLDFIELPQDCFDEFIKASGSTTNFELSSYPSYPNSNPPLGNLTITLEDGYETIIPASELFSLPREYGSNGEFTTTESSRIVALVYNSTLDPYPYYTFGLPFMTMNYLLVDYSLPHFQMAPANRVDFGENYTAQSVKTVCPATTALQATHGASTSIATTHSIPTHSFAPSPQPQHSHTGTIVGAVTGSVVGVALLSALLAFILLRWRRRDQNKDRDVFASSSPEKESKETPPAIAEGLLLAETSSPTTTPTSTPLRQRASTSTERT